MGLIEKILTGKSEIKGYCVKCRKTVYMTNVEEALMNNGKKAYKGQCEFCKKTLYRIKADSREGLW